MLTLEQSAWPIPEESHSPQCLTSCSHTNECVHVYTCNYIQLSTAMHVNVYIMLHSPIQVDTCRQASCSSPAFVQASLALLMRRYVKCSTEFCLSWTNAAEIMTLPEVRVANGMSIFLFHFMEGKISGGDLAAFCVTYRFHCFVLTSLYTALHPTTHGKEALPVQCWPRARFDHTAPRWPSVGRRREKPGTVSDMTNHWCCPWLEFELGFVVQRANHLPTLHP